MGAVWTSLFGNSIYSSFGLANQKWTAAAGAQHVHGTPASYECR
jgi:hypothetical protein